MKALEVTLRRLARRALVAISVVAISALVILLGLLVYLHSAAGRKMLAAKVSALVSRELIAELRIERIDVLGSDRLAISGATFFDAQGRAIVSVRGVTARFDVLRLLANAVFEPVITVELPNIAVERVELGLFHTAKSSLSLIEAFQTRVPSPTPEAPPGKSPRIHLPRIAIDGISVRTDLSGLTEATAEVRALRASFDWSPQLLSLGLSSDDVRVSRALPVAGQARLQVRVRVPGTIEVTLDGNLGDLPFNASFRQTGDELALKLSSDSLTPDAMRALVPAWPLHAPSSIQLELSGRLAAMQVRAEAEAGASRIAASGTVAFSPNVNGELSVNGHGLDAQLFAPELEHTALGVDATLKFAFDPAVRVELSGRVAKGELFGAQLPETTVHVTYTDHRVSGTLASSDPALPVSAEFGVSAEGALSFHAHAQDLNLVALERYGLGARGLLDFDVTGELVQAKLAARFEARVRAFAVAHARAQATLVRCKVQGSTARIEQLGVELHAEGTQLALGAVEFPAWAVESNGTLERQLVSVRAGPAVEPTVQASTTLALVGGMSLSDTRLEAQLNGVKHRLDLKFARLAAQALELRELHWQVGAGSLSGSALIGRTRKRVELEVSGLEAEAVVKTLGLDANALRGRLDAQLLFEEQGRVRHGQLQGSLVDGALPELGAVRAELSATLAGSELAGQLILSAPTLGQGKLSLHGVLAKEPLTVESFTQMEGEVRLDVTDVELEEVRRRWLPTAPLALSGFVAGSVRVSRPDAGAPATVSYELKTRELGLNGSRPDGDGSLLHAQLESHGQITSNETNLQIELKDAAGPWISARVEQRLGWLELLRMLRSSSPVPLLDAAVQAEIVARPRSLELLGAANPFALKGEVAANLNVTGVARRPEIKGSLTATGLGTGTDANGKLELTLDYSAEREDYSFTARYANRRQGNFAIDGGGHWGWFGAEFGRDWSARAEARIEQLELGAIGEQLGVPVSGQAAGHAEFSVSSSVFEATAELTLNRLLLDHHSLGRGSAQLRIHRGLAEAQLKLAGPSSSIELASELGLAWDGGPSVDPRRGGHLDAKVRNYQLATLAPLLRSAASDVRGPLNGFIVLGWDAADAAGRRKTRLRADASIASGSLTLTAGAGSIHCVELRARGDGDDVLRLTLTGCARSNRPNLRAKADVQWNGPVPERINAELRFDRVPLSYDGVVLGTAKVDDKAAPIQLNVNLAGAQRSVEVSIPALEFELPTKDDTNLVDLAADPAIQVTEARTAPESSAETAPSSPLSVSVRLGRAVSLRQAGMRVPVTGTLTRSADGLLDGSIILPEGGVVPQLGQLFRLKRGSIRFEHQAVKDGILSIEASTRTADGVVVDLYVSGTMENPLIRFQSDPPRSESDIVSLLLGVQGSNTATSSGQKGQDPRGSATALAMNQLLRGSALAGVQFGAGQTRAGDSVSTVSVRAGNSVWLEGRTVRSTTQRAASSGAQSSGVVDWRFARGFSLRTQLGNISGLELRWSHRY